MANPIDNDGSILDSDSYASVADSPQEDARRREENHRRWENVRITQDLSQDPNGILSFLLVLFTNVTDENGQKLINDDMLQQLSDALGIDLADMQASVDGISTRSLTPRQAAEDTFSRVDQNNVDWSRAPDVNMSDIIRSNNSPTLLHPGLVERMEDDPTVRQYVQWTLEAAEREGLDGNLLANQYWQESRFNPNAESGAGARGIAQFMPFHEGKWGLENRSDFYDARTSIEAGARFMGHLTEKLGSQELALVAYNGGEKAIDYVDRNTSGDGVSIAQWMGFMEQERAEKGIGASNLWRNQTFGYVAKIDSDYWDADQIALARSQQSELSAQFAMGGVEENDPAQPNPLVDAFDGKGRDETLTSDETLIVSTSTANPTVAPA
ncbi:MAG: lytic transglycosylase domain-containing protein [Alcanivorax sp.]